MAENIKNFVMFGVNLDLKWIKRQLRWAVINQT